MAPPAFDTLGAAKRLEGAGFDRERAEVIAQIVREGQGDLVTRADNKQLETALKADNKQLETALKADNKQLEAELKADLKRLEAKLDSETNWLKWIAGTNIAITVAAASIVVAILA